MPFARNLRVSRAAFACVLFPKLSVLYRVPGFPFGLAFQETRAQTGFALPAVITTHLLEAHRVWRVGRKRAPPPMIRQLDFDMCLLFAQDV